MRYDSAHKLETRARVLKEAAREIRAKGPAGIAVAGIMARAGLTHGGFYAHFASKDALVAEAIGTMFEDARGRFDRSQAEHEPGAALGAYVDFYLSREHRDARDRGCPLPALSSDLARMEPASRERFGKGVATLTAWIAGALEKHGVVGPGAAASSMLSQMVGALSLARAVADPAQSDAILDHARADVKQRYALGATK